MHTGLAEVESKYADALDALKVTGEKHLEQQAKEAQKEEKAMKVRKTPLKTDSVGQSQRVPAAEWVDFCSVRFKLRMKAGYWCISDL